MSVSAAFDPLAELYDLFQDWPRRLAREIGFLEPLFRRHGVRSVLDAACGTGTHLKALADRGFSVAGADLSPEMIAKSRDRLGPEVDLHAVPFTDLPLVATPADAVIVVGNSLPNAGGEEDTRESVAALAGLVNPGGLLVLHSLNYPKLVAAGGGLMPPRRVVDGDREHTFLRLFELHEGGERVILDVIALTRQGTDLSQRLARSTLWPIPPAWLAREVAATGLSVVSTTAGFSDDPFDPEVSFDVVLVARRP